MQKNRSIKPLPAKDPGKFCQARTKQRRGYCKRPSGWGTGHSGQGRCKLHGGSTPVKYGAFSKIIPKEHFHLLEELDLNDLDINHEIIKLKSYLIDLTAAENKQNKEVKFSNFTESELLEFNLKIIGLLDRVINSLEARKALKAKRTGNQEDLRKYISPLIDGFFKVIDESVRDPRVERQDIPREIKKRIMEEPDLFQNG